ncbi:reverse transcriptase domain-containing protein [Tanacetum coccineum]
MLAIPHHSQSISMAEIISKEVKKKSKAGIAWIKLTHQAHFVFALQRSTSCKSKTSAINRAFFTMAVNRTMEQLLEAPIEGLEDALEDPHCSTSVIFNKITSTLEDSESRNPNPEPNVAPVVTPVPKASIPFPSRRNDERRKEKANDQIEKFYEIFRDLSFEISFTDALMLMPKFASTLKTLIGNKEKLSELARTPLNENCSAVILNKLPKKLGDPGRFLIPYLALPETTPNLLVVRVADRSITEQYGIAKDVRLMVGKFQFPADFVVVDFEPDPRVPLILGRCFLKTSHALIDVYECDLLRVGKEPSHSPGPRLKYTADYDPYDGKTKSTSSFWLVMSILKRSSDFLIMGADSFLALEGGSKISAVS